MYISLPLALSTEKSRTPLSPHADAHLRVLAGFLLATHLYSTYLSHTVGGVCTNRRCGLAAVPARRQRGSLAQGLF